MNERKGEEFYLKLDLPVRFLQHKFIGLEKTSVSEKVISFLGERI